MILSEADTQPADKNIKDDDKVDRPQLVGIAGNYGVFTKPSLDTSQTGKQGAWGVTVNQTFATRSNSSPPLKKSPFAAATEALEADVDKHDKGKANGLDARAKQRGDASDLDTSAGDQRPQVPQDKVERRSALDTLEQKVLHKVANALAARKTDVLNMIKQNIAEAEQRRLSDEEAANKRQEQLDAKFNANMEKMRAATQAATEAAASAALAAAQLQEATAAVMSGRATASGTVQTSDATMLVAEDGKPQARVLGRHPAPNGAEDNPSKSARKARSPSR